MILRMSVGAVSLLSIAACVPAALHATERGGVSGKTPVNERVQEPKAYYHFLRGYQSELANETGLALEEYQKALAIDPTSFALHLRLATIYQNRGDHGQAQAHAERVLAQDASNLQALHILAAEAAATTQTERAIEYYNRIVALQPQDGQAYYSIGMLLAGLKRYDEAERILRQGIAAAPASAPVGYIYLGHILVGQKAWDRAAQAYRDA
ncbi:MAG TPA: tetratricopeptide repeat protein, partial [Nitrospirales bacterium]|nr:tetratricopeptide repeat protein [Nitrospirales bacterium]